ncbi:MAG: hypothetical protein JSU04_15290 [Bdellovibrionales bacterium]|nr:hypothetical protein [Bdellovibrionales bacterium]
MFKTLLTMTVLTATGFAAHAGDLRCSGQTSDTRPLVARVTGEEPANDGTVKSVALEIKKNGGFLFQGEKPNGKADAVKGGFALFNLKDRDYNASLAVPVSGNGNAEARVTDIKTKEVLAVIPLQCSKTTGLSNREKNALCLKAAEAAANKEIHKEDKEASIIDDNTTIVDKDGNKFADWENFTGLFVFEYSVNEECLDGLQVETRLKTDAKGRPQCEVIKVEGYGQRDCG